MSHKIKVQELLHSAVISKPQRKITGATLANSEGAMISAAVLTGQERLEELYNERGVMKYPSNKQRHYLKMWLD